MIGSIVHYVSYGTPGGEFGRECRAAIVTEVTDSQTVGLCVLNPTGAYFNREVPMDAGEAMTLPHESAAETATGHAVLCGARSYRGGTWHEPAHVPGGRPPRY